MLMKLVTATFATAVLLALAGVAPSARAQAQDQKQQQDKTPAKPQKSQQQQKPAHHVTPPAHQPKAQHPQDQQKQQEKGAQKTQQQVQKNQQKAQQQQQKAAKTQQKQEQQQNASREHTQPANRRERAQQSTSGGGHPVRGNPQQTAHYEQAHFRRYQPARGERVARIPDAQFNAHFGRGHRFHIGPPMMVGGFPRFQYSGFWFVLEEPWPNYWGYDSDDFYVMFTDGNYWLCNYDDPGVQIELVVIAG
jgi:hypothetical protein